MGLVTHAPEEGGAHREMRMWRKNLILLSLAAFLVILPLWLLPNATFSGTDGEAEDVVLDLNPDYEPWAKPLLEPVSGEVESLLFALQAALGAGVMGFALGRITKKAATKDASHGD